MADYKDIITGTIKNLAGKAKDFAESSTVRGIYEHGAERAKAYGAIAKLTLEISGDTEELKRAYTEIGKLYFEQARENPEGFFAPLFAQVEEINGRIHANEDAIADIKAQIEAENADSDGLGIDISVEFGDFDDVVGSTEADGTGADSAPAEDKPADNKTEE